MCFIGLFAKKYRFIAIQEIRPVSNECHMNSTLHCRNTFEENGE